MNFSQNIKSNPTHQGFLNTMIKQLKEKLRRMPYKNDMLNSLSDSEVKNMICTCLEERNTYPDLRNTIMNIIKNIQTYSDHNKAANASATEEITATLSNERLRLPSNREDNYWQLNPVSFMLNKSMVGKTIARYQILQKLGCGRMGVVYKALDLILERFVTVKFLPFHLMIDEKAKKRFIHEAKSLSALDHPNICSIFNICETAEGFLFIVMPFYDGKTLRLMIDEHRLTIDDVCRIGLQIGQGLFKAHEKGIVHRDVKPDNIIVTNDNIVKLIDFGLAKLKESTRITEIGTTMGTVAYMSPEQTHGIQVDARTDIWSLGVVIYEMLTGKLPFRGDYAPAVIYSIINEEVEEIDAIFEGMRDIILKCLAKDPNDRYANMKELLRDLREMVDGEKRLSLDYTYLKYTKPAKLWPAFVIFINLVLPAIVG